MDLPYIVDPNGIKRILAKLPPTDYGKLKAFKSVFPLMDRKDWTDLDNRHLFGGKDWILNQGQHGSCTGQGSAGAARRTRVLRGLPDIKLSPTYLYAQINGNRDNGSVIGDALTTLMSKGTCRFDLSDQNRIFMSQQSAAAKADAINNTIGEGYHCGTFDELGTALQLKFMVVAGIRVANNYTVLNKYKVSGVTRGQANHCIACDGMIQLPNGQWALDHYGSWGSDIMDNGRSYLTEDHFAYADDMDFYAIRTMNENKNVDTDFPVLNV